MEQYWSLRQRHASGFNMAFCDGSVQHQLHDRPGGPPLPGQPRRRPWRSTGRSSDPRPAMRSISASTPTTRGPPPLLGSCRGRPLNRVAWVCAAFTRAWEIAGNAARVSCAYPCHPTFPQWKLLGKLPIPGPPYRRPPGGRNVTPWRLGTCAATISPPTRLDPLAGCPYNPALEKWGTFRAKT